jgi:hypothetical protein
MLPSEALMRQLMLVVTMALSLGLSLTAAAAAAAPATAPGGQANSGVANSSAATSSAPADLGASVDASGPGQLVQTAASAMLKDLDALRGEYRSNPG